MPTDIGNHHPDIKRKLQTFETSCALARERRKTKFHKTGNIQWSDSENLFRIFFPGKRSDRLLASFLFYEGFRRTYLSYRRVPSPQIPVLFVHGTEGSPHNWIYLWMRMDHTRYQPLFFYYPSGIRLSLAAALLDEELKDLHAKYNFKKNGCRGSQRRRINLPGVHEPVCFRQAKCLYQAVHHIRHALERVWNGGCISTAAPQKHPRMDRAGNTK